MNEDCSRNESCTRTKYTYDALGQLSTPVTAGSSAYPKWGLQWTYDRYGNRLSQTATAGSPPQNSVTVNPNTNCLTGTGYSCDASGNMTGDGINTLTYDAENRVSTAAGPYGGATYTYDGNGLRVEKQVTGGTTTVYIFSGSKVIAEYDNGAALSLPQTPTPPKPQPTPPQPQMTPQQRCSAATKTVSYLGATAAINWGGAVVTSELPPLGAIFAGIATVESIGTGVMAVYAAYVCFQ